jgi:glutathione S-transferase
MTPILYSFRRCPYAMRARMALLKSGVSLNLREIALRDKPEHMLEISPKGTVPVLQTSESDVLEESLDIMCWALKQSDPDGWLAGFDKTLIAENDSSFKAALDRYKYPDQFPEDCLDARDNGLAFLETLNSRLEQTPQLCGPNVTITDIAIFPFVRQFMAVDSNWSSALPLPGLHKWLKGHMDSPLFKTIMVKYKPWLVTGKEQAWPIPIQA